MEAVAGVTVLTTEEDHLIIQAECQICGKKETGTMPTQIREDGNRDVIGGDFIISIGEKGWRFLKTETQTEIRCPDCIPANAISIQ